MNKPIVNMAASVRQRLLNLARERKEDFGLVLTKYGLERVLYRIAQSKHREAFVLKGALLFELWTEQRYRPTRDADFLARGENSPERFVAIFKEICEMHVEDDGLHFDAGTVTAERITEDADYEGVRVKFVGHLENARIPIQIDLSFGDVHACTRRDGNPIASRLTKCQAADLSERPWSRKSSRLWSAWVWRIRMKDFYDILSLSRDFPFEAASLSEAIKKTFARRDTKLPSGTPLVFTSECFEDGEEKTHGRHSATRTVTTSLKCRSKSVCKEIATFLMPLVEALNGMAALPKKWLAGSWEN